MSVNRAGVSTMAPVTSPAKHVRHGPTPAQSAEAWALIYPLLKVRKRTCIFSTDTMVKRRGLVWMTLQQKDYSPGWMGVLINSATGRRNNRTTLGERTAYTHLVLDMDTSGMTWIAMHVINIIAKKVIKPQADHPMYSWLIIVHLRRTKKYAEIYNSYE